MLADCERRLHTIAEGGIFSASNILIYTTNMDDLTPYDHHECQIWQLVHLISAATHELSTCLSLNSLLQATRFSSEENLVTSYHTSLCLSRKSLAGFVQSCGEMRDRMPKYISQDDTVKTEMESRAYTALVTAAHLTRQIKPPLDALNKIEAQTTSKAVRVSLTIAQDVVEFAGWSKSDALSDLQDIHDDLVAFRDRGVDRHQVGWKSCWKKWRLMLEH